MMNGDFGTSPLKKGVSQMARLAYLSSLWVANGMDRCPFISPPASANLRSWWIAGTAWRASNATGAGVRDLGGGVR